MAVYPYERHTMNVLISETIKARRLKSSIQTQVCRFFFVLLFILSIFNFFHFIPHLYYSFYSHFILFIYE